MKKRFSIAILVMGFSGLVAQILLLRELLIVFSGNELCIGIILANWLILEAFGSYFLGRRAEVSQYKLEAFSVITILFSLTLLIAIYLTRILKGVMGLSIGESIGLLSMFYSSFLILSAVSILHGALFTYSCRIYSLFSGTEETSAGRVYVYETVGTIIGGIACTYFFIPYYNTFLASTGLALLNFLACLVLLAPSWGKGLFPKTVLVVLSVLIFFSGYLLFTGKMDKLHHYSINAQWKNQNIVHYQNSRYGNICILENEGQYIFFLDGIPNIITPIPDIPYIEEFVHLPLLAHPEPAKILILSGGAGGLINEALKHPSIEAVEYAELDPLLLALIKKFPTPLTESELYDRRVKIRHVDGRLLLKTSQNKYDLIFIGIQEPSSLQTNRFFTKEFFSLTKERLNKGGILVLGLPGSLTYLNDELRNLNSCILHTLKNVFSHIRVFPGDGRNLFLSSDSQEITMIDKVQVTERLSQRNIAANLIVPWHIEKKLHQGWQDWFSRFLEGGSKKINSDFTPLGLFYSISHWNTVFAPSLRGIFKQLERVNLRGIVPLFVIMLLSYFLFRSKKTQFLQKSISLSIITTGFAGMIFDLMIIFTFQSIYGYVFSWIGILVASFMAGAACGAMIITTALARIKNCLKFFIKIELAIICFAIAFPLVFHAAQAHLGGLDFFFIFRMIFLVISFISGLLTGSQFPLANQLYLQSSKSLSRTAGLLYASDLLGGWLGGILGAVVLLPVLGLTGTCITVGLLKLTSFTVIATQPNRHLLGEGL
ncbi:MAG: spermine synthase [Deltaproteobacteria bacterium]|jgi:spermidine synthase|nr:spermine synthase [Deltaproteobacteria bacterium]